MWLVLVLTWSIAAAWYFRRLRPLVLLAAVALQLGNTLLFTAGLLSLPTTRRISFLTCALILFGLALVMHRVQRLWQRAHAVARADNDWFLDRVVGQIASTLRDSEPARLEEALESLPYRVRTSVVAKMGVQQFASMPIDETEDEDEIEAGLLPQEGTCYRLFLAAALFALVAPLLAVGIRYTQLP